MCQVDLLQLFSVVLMNLKPLGRYLAPLHYSVRLSKVLLRANLFL
jgi:hypothetical protein